MRGRAGSKRVVPSSRTALHAGISCRAMERAAPHVNLNSPAHSWRRSRPRSAVTRSHVPNQLSRMTHHDGAGKVIRCCCTETERHFLDGFSC